MGQKYKEYDQLSLTKIADQVLNNWENQKIFEKSVESRPADNPFVFFEGPPSANGLPGIHHVMARAIKDIFCRYKTLKGYRVERKAGWDTHGLPVELGVEKELGITKEDIGKEISVEAYNEACRKAVMKYTDVWNDLTRKMGYWVDMENPYITYESKYMETVWWLLKQLYEKGLIYKGYTIQPYSPKAGTGLSSHELNQPGSYRDVKDTSCVAQFKALEGQNFPFNLKDGEDVYFLAWTTTPWTLPSNTALTVGKKIEYVLIRTFNQYTKEPLTAVVAKPLIQKQLTKPYVKVDDAAELESFTPEDKKIPYCIVNSCIGADLVDLKYEQLFTFAQPLENADQAFRIIPGDFVTTEDGTGIVHTAPTFGADDAQVAKENGIPPLLVLDDNGNKVPLVDLQGRFRKEAGKFAGMYVKNEYYTDEEMPEKSLDVQLCIQLKERNRAFKVEKYSHNYPHCWRTDKPILYYPLDSWFIKVTDHKEELIANNKKINWKPESTGTGRFGNWLENVNDWNLSRSRYWGIPIPIWVTEGRKEQKCIGSVEELKNECQKAVDAGVMKENPLKDFEPGNMDAENYNKVDLHKNFMDQITLVSESGKAMQREADLIDVWFDSGSMPYAQWHYPFENKEKIENNMAYPADFIAEGVDQTRGWFYTLHTISTLCFGGIAYKNVVSNGLVLDKNGQKMSKRLGNAVEPFETLKKYGPDATRWYMITNAQPWDNLKFNLEGITEVQRKFFGTLYNTYNFFALYANIDGFTYEESEILQDQRPEIDRWILSELNSLMDQVDAAYEAYEPTKAGRLIQSFVIDKLSNWYVRLCRRRFWKGDYTDDKISAYQTLYTCLEKVAIMSSPIAPFFMDQLFNDLNQISSRYPVESVHLAEFPKANKQHVDQDLEARMDIARQVSSMVLGLRKKEGIKVRQPLQKIMVPILDKDFARRIEAVQDIILSEINVKELELLEDTTGVLVKKIKPNFKTIGPKYGKLMKQIAKTIAQFDQKDIADVEQNDGKSLEIEGETVELNREDFEITTDDIPGWLVASEGKITVALDITITEPLKYEGYSRELVNRVQNLRKSSGLEVTDKIVLNIQCENDLQQAFEANCQYISDEVLANEIRFDGNTTQEEEIEEGVTIGLGVEKV